VAASSQAPLTSQEQWTGSGEKPAPQSQHVAGLSGPVIWPPPWAAQGRAFGGDRLAGHSLVRATGDQKILLRKPKPEFSAPR